MVDVFISYKQEERDAVLVVAAALADLKVEVWFDTKLRAGGSFDQAIADALGAAKAVLVCWTPAAIQSEWVRSEATEGLNSERLAACFLHPTNLIPPFNLIHAENLSAWAGQTDDPAWLKLLDRLGELLGRPGLAGYGAVMRPGASIEELQGWAQANGDDPLVDTVWARIALLQGEGAEARLAREKVEARAAADIRRAQAEKSRRLARERGLRDPVRERRRFLVLVGSLAATVILVIGAIAYFNDEQERDRILRDEVTTTDKARSFLAANAWHPIARAGREKFDRLDADAWLAARTDGGIKALQAYIDDAQKTPNGQFLARARDMLVSAERVREVQKLLARMRFYDGPATGTYDQATQKAIALFRYRHLMPVSTDIDDALQQKLAEALTWWTRPRLDELRAQTLEKPTEADYVRFAQGIGVDAATISAVIDVEAAPVSGFDADGRIKIVFERQIFSRSTEHRYDESHPVVSNPQGGGYTPHEYDRLAEAYALDPDAALKATSWGRLQIMGLYHQRYGFDTVGEFVRFMSLSEANQLEAGILGFIHANKALSDALRAHDWTAFVKGFNGIVDKAHRYDERMGEAYQRHAAEIAARTTAAPAPPTPPDPKQ
jgi:hypothetical protein